MVQGLTVADHVSPQQTCVRTHCVTCRELLLWMWHTLGWVITTLASCSAVQQQCYCLEPQSVSRAARSACNQLALCDDTLASRCCKPLLAQLAGT
eukprot:3353-Heterococcus_DN1.PRE.2